MDLSKFNRMASVFILLPSTRWAGEWIEENLDPEAQRFGGGVVVENRYLGPILDGIEEAGLMAEFEVQS